MSPSDSNPVLDSLREIAIAMPNAEEGVSCNNATFQVGGKNFYFLGMQKGEVLSRLKLVDSLAEAEELAAKDEARYSAGKGGWVTVRLSPTGRLPKQRMKKWIAESYRKLVPKKLQG